MSNGYDRKGSFFMEKEAKIFTKTAVVIICALLCNFLWGSAFPGIKLGYQQFAIARTVDQIFFAGIRFAFAGIMVIAFHSIQNKQFMYPRNRADALRVFKLSCFQTFLQYILFYVGLSNTSGVKAAIVEGSNVFVSIFIAWIAAKMIGESGEMSVRILAGCLIGFFGVVLVNLSGGKLDAGFSFWGEGFIFLSTIAYGFSTVLIKKYARESDTVLLSGWQFLTGGLLLALCGLAGGGSLPQVNAPGIGILLYLAFVSAVAYTLWGMLLKHNPVSKIAVFGFSNPVFGVLLSAVLLGEGNIIDLRCLLALVLVCGGIYLVNKKTN